MEPPREQLLTLLHHPGHALNEEDLLLLWKYLCPRLDGLRTVRDNTVRVRDRGTVGRSVGPDVSDVTLELDGIRRSGDLEIHRQTADWYRHGHHRNSNFNTVVLHLVLTGAEEPVRRQDDHWVDTLVLEPYLDDVRDELREGIEPSVRERRRQVKRPCYREQPDEEKIGETLARAGDAWLAKRAGTFREEPRDGFVRELIGALGYTRNHDAFDRLARRSDLTRFRGRVSANASTDFLEGYLLGVGGWLDEQPGSLNRTMTRRRRTWKTRWSENEPLVDSDNWTRSGVRPQARPIRRWVCFGWATRRVLDEFPCWSRWLRRQVGEELERNPGTGTLRRALDRVFRLPPNNYWRRHYSRTDDVRTEVPRSVGRTWFDQVSVNVLLPYLYFRSVYEGRPGLREAVEETFREAPPSLSNRRTRRIQRQWGFENGDFEWGSVRRQQGAVHLYKEGCVEDNCGECPLNVGEATAEPSLFEDRR